MAVPPVDPKIPGVGAMLSWKSVRGKGEAEGKDRESTIEWWWVLAFGAFFGLLLLLLLL